MSEQYFNAPDYFIKDNIGSMYFGELGLSLSNKFIVNQSGQVFFKEGVIGGVLDSLQGEETNLDLANMQKKWIQGWNIRQDKIWTKWKSSDGTETDFSAWYTRHAKSENGKDLLHYFCLGSPSTTNFIKAKFRVQRDGDIFGSTVLPANYDEEYGPNVLRLTSWGSTKIFSMDDAKTNYLTVVGNTEESWNKLSESAKQKELDKLFLHDAKFRISIYPNRIYFRHNYSPTNVLYENVGAEMRYVPGAYGEDMEGKNGHYFHFSAPVKTNAIYLSNDAIRYITTDVITSDEATYENKRYFYVGPSEKDVRDKYNKKKYQYDPAGYTVVRGRAIELEAYGYEKDMGKYEGYINTRCQAMFLKNDSALRGMKKGFWNPRSKTKEGKNSWNQLIKLGDNNRVIVGGATNSASTEIRSPHGIYLKTNGVTGDKTSQYTIYFGPLDFTIGNQKKTRMAIRPQYDPTNVYGKDNAETDDFNEKGKIISYVRLGTENYRWYAVYTNKMFNVSDRRFKTDIQNIDAKYLQLFDLLQPVSYKYNHLYQSEEGNHQVHFGYIAQDVKAAMQQVGLGENDFAGLETSEETGYHSLDYTKFVALNTAKIQQLDAVIQKQSELIQQQQKQIDLLLSKLA
jgi:hypothetical protein